MLLSYIKLINKTFKVNRQTMNISISEQKLFELATKARNNAYAPYSHFAVGAAIESENQNFYVGCNVENLSYPVGTCAEAGAIAAMIAGGDKQICRILILADGKELIAPCGACLQRIQEFADDSTIVLLANPQGIQKQFTIAELLPFGFTNSELKK